MWEECGILGSVQQLGSCEGKWSGYYNTSTNKIYTATAENTWGITGEDPTNLDIYVDLEHTKLYYYDGTNFKSYGGGSGTKEVGYVDEELEGTEKILIEDGDFDGVPVNEVVTMETITNDNGTAIKFSDGTMICYKDISGVVNISNASGSGYYGTLSVDSLFPQEFVEIPIISTGLRNTEWVMASSVTATATQITKIIILSLKSDGSKNVHVNVIAIGKWK